MPSIPDFDHAIIGFGLAGATLECELTKRGDRVLVLDRVESGTSSKIAAGLLTPITGKRFATTPHWRELWPQAERFYRNIEAEADCRFLHTDGAIRVFADEDECTRFEARRHTVADLVADAGPIPSSLNAPLGGFQMNSARLDVAAFLESRRKVLADRFQVADVSPQAVQVANGVVELPTGQTSKRVTFCCGFDARPNPWFPQVGFEAAKGEMLLVKIPQFAERRTIHAHGVWLAPTGTGSFRTGATYEWDALDSVATPAAADWLRARLSRFLTVEFTVTDHVAAVRPIVEGRQPVVGVNGAHPAVGYINGLGSKGSLLGPEVANQFAQHIHAGRPIDAEYCLENGLVKLRGVSSSVRRAFIAEQGFQRKTGLPRMFRKPRLLANRVLLC